MDEIRYNRASKLFRISAEHLATDAHAIRERLMVVDKELFLLQAEDVSSNAAVRQLYEDLRAKATHIKQKNGEGDIAATIQGSRLSSLSAIARLIFEIDRAIMSSSGR